MIRSARIPSVLNRVCDDQIHMALMVTSDGELLGVSNKKRITTNINTNNSLSVLPNNLPDPETLGTLIADIAVDYHQLGEEFSLLSSSSSTSNTNNSGKNYNCILIEMEYGTIGVATCCCRTVSQSLSTSTAGSANATGTVTTTNPTTNSSTTTTTTGAAAVTTGTTNSSIDYYFVIVVAPLTTVPGLIKSRLCTLAQYVQESLSTPATTTIVKSSNTIATATSATTSGTTNDILNDNVTITTTQ